MKYKIAQLSLTPGKNARTISDVFIAQPDSIKESLAGKLFIVLEIEAPGPHGLKIINFLIDNINHSYYNNEKILLREKITTLKVEHIFEASLAKVNKNFQEYLKNNRIKFDIGNINVTVGIIYQNMLHFAHKGKNKVLLIHPKKPKVKPAHSRRAEPEKIEYQITDISRESGAGGEEAAGKSQGTKIFTNVISGKIPKGAHFIFTNEALPEYISGKQLVKIVGTLPPLSAIEQLKNILSRVNSYVSFLAIIIKSTAGGPTGAEAVRANSQPAADRSVIDLNQTEQNTENLLSPSGLINFKKWMAHLPLDGRGKKSRPAKIYIKDKIIVKKKGRKITKKILGILIVMAQIFSGLFEVLKNIFKGRKIMPDPSVVAAPFKKAGNLLRLMRNMNRKNKALLLVSFACLLFLVANIGYLKFKEARQVEEDNYNELTDLIEQKQNQAEANLIYSNEEGAKELFDEIAGLMAEFPRETEEQQEQYERFSSKYNEHMEKIRRVTRVDEAANIADFSKLTAQASAENLSLVEGGKIYAGDSAQRSIYILNTGDNLVTTLTDLEQPISALKYPAVSDDYIYYFNLTDIVQLELAGERISIIEPLLPGNKNGYIAADTYSNRLYLLNAEEDQIYRYTRSGGYFSDPLAWINKNMDLKEAVDLSIDGYVYILFKDGNVTRMSRGVPDEDWSLEAVDPPIQEARKISARIDSNFIYILEPLNNRLIVYDKQGQFIMQYMSDKLYELKDFVVDENEKLVYLLNGNTVYKTAAVHAE